MIILTERAQQIWTELCQLPANDQISKTRPELFRAYCETLAELEDAEKNMREGGTMMITPNGEVKPSPWVALVDSRRKLALQLSKGLEIGTKKKRR